MSLEEREAKKKAARAKLIKSKKGTFAESSYKKSLYTTGVYSLDKKLYGGLPFGKMVEIFGKNSSGKTSLALKAASQVNNINYETGETDFSRKNPCSVAYLDLENSFDDVWASKLGFERYEYGNDVDEVMGGDTVGDVVKDFIDDDLYSMIIIDSLDAMFPINVLEHDMETNDMGLRAKTLYRAIRKWLVSLAKSYQRNEGCR